ncbi:MAG: SPFH domain-containing protein [Clostridiales bacterium]|nr:SPFH domain-containing protein [Clostridiales bacterium]
MKNKTKRIEVIETSAVRYEDGSLEAVGAVTNDDLFFRHRLDGGFCANARIVVDPAYCALMIKDGQVVQTLKPGTYAVFGRQDFDTRLFTKELNVSSLYAAFIPLTMRQSLKWGTPVRIDVRDPATGIPVSVGGNGECIIETGDPIRFYLKTVGAAARFTLDMLQQRVQGIIVGELTDRLAAVVTERKLSYVDFDGAKKSIADRLLPTIADHLADLGIAVKAFMINKLDIPPEQKERLAAAARQEPVVVRVCPQCGNPCEAEQRYCFACGSRVAPYECAVCHTVVPAGHKFCAGCGARAGD